MKIVKFIYLILGFLWIYQGLIPKVLFTSLEEIQTWQWLGLSAENARLAGQVGGVVEIIFGLIFLFSLDKRLHYLNIIGLVFLLGLMSVVIPSTLIQAFNPVVMNISMISLSCIALMLYRQNIAQ